MYKFTLFPFAFRPVYTCVCVHAYLQVCVCEHVYVPEVDVGNHSLLLSYLIYWGQVSQSNAECWYGLYYYPVHSGDPFSPLSEAGIIGVHCAQAAFKWLLGIQIRPPHLHSKCFNRWTISPTYNSYYFYNSNTILALVCTSVWFQDALSIPF